MIRIGRLERHETVFNQNFLNIEYKIEDVEERLNRIELAKENIELTKPMKPNNWDSIKQVFKKPARSEINESN